MTDELNDELEAIIGQRPSHDCAGWDCANCHDRDNQLRDLLARARTGEGRDKRYQRLVAADREFACGFDLGLDLLVSRFHAAENNLDAAESRLRRLVQQMEALRTNAGNAVTLAQRSHDGDAPYARGQVAAFAAVLDLIKEAAT
jgi:hypothetical protein